MKGTVKKKKMKPLVKLGVILASIVLFFGIILGGAIGYFRLSANSYYLASQTAFLIPGLNDGYIPQGLCYDDKSQTFILSGYKNNHSPSPVYLVKNGELVKSVTLLTPDKKDYTGHGGGIDVGGDFIYLAGGSDCCIYVYSYSDLMSAKNGDKLNCLGKIPLLVSETDYLGNAFVTVVGDRLITGEFYRDGNYPTLDTHKITTSAGDYNQALALEYKLDPSKEFGVDLTPVKAYSMPDLVQGFTIHDGKIYLSTSWGLSFSTIYEYDQSKLTKEKDITVLGSTVPLYALDSASLTASYKIAPMSEEIVFVEGLLYVNCESASSKYIFGKFTGGQYLYKTDLSKMK